MTTASALGGAPRLLHRSARSDRLAASPLQVVAKFHVAIAIALVVLALAFANLVLGEFLPKQIARCNPDATARWLALPIVAV